MDVLRNELILPITWNVIGQEILANFVLKYAEGQILVEKILVY
jgi:hypothetical protein